jgi:hypothetical protein
VLFEISAGTSLLFEDIEGVLIVALRFEGLTEASSPLLGPFF